MNVDNMIILSPFLLQPTGSNQAVYLLSSNYLAHLNNLKRITFSAVMMLTT